MHPLHDYFAKQFADKLTRRHVVVWYDPRREFTPFFGERRPTSNVLNAPRPPYPRAGRLTSSDQPGSFHHPRSDRSAPR
jgi:hypothetical protein